MVSELRLKKVIRRIASIDIKKGNDGLFYLSLVAPNGEKVINDSDGLVTLDYAASKAASIADAFESANVKYVLKSGRKVTIADSLSLLMHGGVIKLPKAVRIEVYGE